MTKVDLQYDLINYTPASASPPEANFNRIEQHVNQELIERDGTVAMRAQLKLVGDPISELDAAPKQYVDQVLPIGIIMMYGGAAAPAGGRWALCNGAEVQTADYPELFAVIGSAYGSGSAGRFNLPNLTDKFPRGAAPGATGGSADAPIVTHTHPIDHGHAEWATSNELQAHAHAGPDHLHGVSLMTGAMDRYSAHSHWVRGAADSSNATGYGEGNVADISLTGFGPAFNTAESDINHLHPVNGATQGADRSLNTSNELTPHTHTTATPVFSGASGAPAGAVAVANANLPPYLGVTYILRVK